MATSARTKSQNITILRAADAMPPAVESMKELEGALAAMQRIMATDRCVAHEPGCSLAWLFVWRIRGACALIACAVRYHAMSRVSLASFDMDETHATARDALWVCESHPREEIRRRARQTIDRSYHHVMRVVSMFREHAQDVLRPHAERIAAID